LTRWFRIFRIVSVISFLTITQGCQTAPTARPTEIPAIQTASTTPDNTEKHPVVLISWDGARIDTINSLMEAGLLPTFASLAENGVSAEYAQTIDPPLTAAAHNSIASGAYPTHTGITSNSFHVIGDDFYWYRKGFEESMDDAEPVWVTASRSGLTTAAVFFPGGTPAITDQLADYTIGYGIEDAYSKQWDISLSDADGWTDTPVSFSIPKAGRLTIQNVGPVYLYVFDATDDRVENYDTVIINTEQSGLSPAQTLKESDWGSLILLKHSFSGADFLIQDISSERVTLYHTGVDRNTAFPKKLLDNLNEQFGPFPAGGDYYALEHGWITEEDYLYQLEKQSVYMAKVAAWVFSTCQPDLMLTWQDPFDSAGHQFWMTDARQTNFSPELAELYHDYYNRAASVADRSLSIILDAFDLNRTTVFLAGDHGMAPIHSSVFVNTILEQAGLLTLDNQNAVVINKSKAFAIVSGGAAHVYINLEGREKGGGIVTEAEYPAVVEQIIGLLKDLADPVTGDLVFQRVLPRNELGALGLDHPNSGDVFVQAYPGYALDGWRGNDFIFAPVDYYGQHGYDSNLPEMRTIFIAAGAGVNTAGQVIPPVKVIDYAPTIALLLSFQPATTVDGTPIPFFIQP
jgi:predicted AlkP superfamily pyrophosphatase or phosphodiesterase